PVYTPPPTPLFPLITPRPPSSTLFPYTTLFRSHIQTLLVGDADVLSEQLTQVRHNPERIAVHHAAEAVGMGERPQAALDERPGSDRKSTRLNSSHRTISYAVFCLKKKKTQTNRR